MSPAVDRMRAARISAAQWPPARSTACWRGASAALHAPGSVPSHRTRTSGFQRPCCFATAAAPRPVRAGQPAWAQALRLRDTLQQVGLAHEDLLGCQANEPDFILAQLHLLAWPPAADLQQPLYDVVYLCYVLCGEAGARRRPPRRWVMQRGAAQLCELVVKWCVGPEKKERHRARQSAAPLWWAPARRAARCANAVLCGSAAPMPAGACDPARPCPDSQRKRSTLSALPQARRPPGSNHHAAQITAADAPWLLGRRCLGLRCGPKAQVSG